ncbi:MAG: helix-turn-helix transcriptional regulator [Planctomycetia bacterium]|nr:helix-turn-helix transcriptional regulator [Planctomycetia bacterium]
MDNKRTNPDYVNGLPELLVLQLLARKPRYGYELVQAIAAATQSALSFGEGCIYAVLHRLEHEGFLTSTRETVGGRSRVVYHVTRQGRKQLAERASAWEKVVRAVGQVLHNAVPHGEVRHGAVPHGHAAQGVDAILQPEMSCLLPPFRRGGREGSRSGGGNVALTL